MVKSNDIRNMTVEEVEQHLHEAREELWRLRFRAATEQLANPLLLRTRRKEVAKYMTALSEHRRGLHTLAHAQVTTPEAAPDEGAAS